ncbi:MAG: hypothetical protein HRU20_07760 [Pseudomonadales bacterium]|nr:hypothetical protein [Pseudomonadales bacterium]
MFLKKDRILPLFSEYFWYVAYENIAIHYPEIDLEAVDVDPVDISIAELKEDAIACLLIPNLSEDWQLSLKAKIPYMMIIRLSEVSIGVGWMTAQTLENVRSSFDIREYSYSLQDFYTNTNRRRNLMKYIGKNERLIDRKFRKKYAEHLIDELKDVMPGRDQFEDYERVVKKILDFFFDDCGATGESQKQASNKSYRFDICYYIELFRNEFWEKIRDETGASHIIVECKNSVEKRELDRGVSQAKKYFDTSNAGACGIITIRDKSSLSKIKQYSKLIENRKAFLLVLDDRDLEGLIMPSYQPIILPKADNVLEIYDRCSFSILYKMMEDNRLEH